MRRTPPAPRSATVYVLAAIRASTNASGAVGTSAAPPARIAFGLLVVGDPHDGVGLQLRGRCPPASADASAGTSIAFTAGLAASLSAQEQVGHLVRVAGRVRPRRVAHHGHRQALVRPAREERLVAGGGPAVADLAHAAVVGDDEALRVFVDEPVVQAARASATGRPSPARRRAGCRGSRSRSASRRRCSAGRRCRSRW